MTRILVLLAGISILLLLTCFGCEGERAEDSDGDHGLAEVATSDYQWTGVAVSKEGRIFVNFPRWSANVPVSVGELLGSGEIVPYPDTVWNAWDPSVEPGERFVCVQSVHIDDMGRLWVLDPASPFLQGAVPGGPKMALIDLGSNSVERVYAFDSKVAGPASYLNDVRVETKTNTAYITDSGTGAILVLDLETGSCRRLLGDHPSTKAEDIILRIAGNEIPIRVHSDGIALDAGGGYLYYQALTGRTLYRIATEKLRDPSISENELGSYVENVGESGPSDGLLFRDGFVYLTSIEENAIRRMEPLGAPETVAQDSLLEWPDSFAAGQDGAIYVTTSRIAFPPGTGPHRLFRLSP